MTLAGYASRPGIQKRNESARQLRMLGHQRSEQSTKYFSRDYETYTKEGRR